MYRACSRCGRIHDANHPCVYKRAYRGGEERELRNTYAWHKKSEEIRKRANYLCEVCKDQGTYTYDKLEVHHIEKVRNDKEKLLDDANLVCLCVYHHKEADRGDLEAEYLRELAKRRDADIPGGVFASAL